MLRDTCRRRFAASGKFACPPTQAMAHGVPAKCLTKDSCTGIFRPEGPALLRKNLIRFRAPRYCPAQVTIGGGECPISKLLSLLSVEVWSACLPLSFSDTMEFARLSLNIIAARRFIPAQLWSRSAVWRRFALSVSSKSFEKDLKSSLSRTALSWPSRHSPEKSSRGSLPT